MAFTEKPQMSKTNLLFVCTAVQCSSGCNSLRGICPIHLSNPTYPTCPYSIKLPKPSISYYVFAVLKPYSNIPRQWKLCEHTIPSVMVFFSQISHYAIGQLQLNLAGAAATDHRWPFPCDRFPLWPQAARLTLDSRIRQTGRKPRLAARHEWCQDAVSILPIVLRCSLTPLLVLFASSRWDAVWILPPVLRCSLNHLISIEMQSELPQ